MGQGELHRGEISDLPYQNVSCTFIDFDRSLASSKASTADANGSDADISGDNTAVRTLVISAREDLEIAREVRRLLS